MKKIVLLLLPISWTILASESAQWVPEPPSLEEIWRPIAQDVIVQPTKALVRSSADLWSHGKRTGAACLASATYGAFLRVLPAKSLPEQVAGGGATIMLVGATAHSGLKGAAEAAACTGLGWAIADYIALKKQQ